MGGDNYRKEHRKQYVKCLRVEAEKLLLNGDLWETFGASSGCVRGLGLTQTLVKRNWILNRKLGIYGVDEE